MHGEANQFLRESFAAFTNRTNGRGHMPITTLAGQQAYTQLIHQMQSAPQGRPLIIQDSTTGEIEFLPGLDGPIS
jgi:hypothetical protein